MFFQAIAYYRGHAYFKIFNRLEDEQINLDGQQQLNLRRAPRPDYGKQGILSSLDGGYVQRSRYP